MAAKTTDPIDILLEMGIDLDNLSEEEDYLSALMEAANTLTIKDTSDPRITPLQQEILKLRKKRFNKARPEAKKTTIKPDAFFDGKSDEEKSGTIDSSKLKYYAPKQKALPTSALSSMTILSSSSKGEGAKKKRAPRKSDPLKDILKGVNSIIEILKRQQKLSAKQAEKDRKRAEKQRREGAEDKLEDSGIKNFISGATKLVKPVKEFLDGLFNFIKNVLIGTVLIKIINWFTDPENQEKIEAIGDFFKNTWPVLLAAYLLFGNSLGRFAVKLIKVVGGFVIKLASKIIPALITGIKRLGLGNSLALGGLAVGGAMLAGRMMDGGEDDKDLNQPDGKQKTPPPDKESEPAVIPAPAVADPPEPPTVTGRFDMEASQGYINDKPVSLEEYQTFQNMSNQEKVQKYGTGMKGGGVVPGRGPNKDTVPAMLAPGEFVMSRGAVQKYGADTMASMNAAGGGTNLPKRMNGVTYAAGGGLMGNRRSRYRRGHLADMSGYGYGDDKKEKQSAQVEKEMKDREKKNPKSPPPEPPSAPDSERTIGEADPNAKVEPLPDNFSDKQAFMHIYNIAKKVGGTKWPEIVAAQAMHETGYLKVKPSVYFATGKTNPFGQTGDRGYGTIPRAGDPAGWTKYPNLEESVRDHIKLWHNVSNHPQNYNAHDTILDGIAAVAPAYSPNADPANIRLGYTVDGYSKGMVRALKVGGFDPKTKRTGAAPKMTPGGSTPGPSSVTPSGSTPGGVSPSGTTVTSLSNYKVGSGIAMLTGGKTAAAGVSPSGTTFASLTGKRSFQSPPAPPSTSPPPTSVPSDSMPEGSQQGSSANSASKMKNNANNFPEIDANAMISMEKIKVLGMVA